MIKRTAARDWRRRRLAALAVSLALALTAQPLSASPCPPNAYSRSDLLDLKSRAFEFEDAAERNALAMGLTACTGDADPAIRDGVAYEALALWMRGGMLEPATIDAIGSELLGQLAAPDDPNGFRKPFAALILSEVARTDRIEPFFSPGRREALVGAAASYLRGLRDYRGFSETEGWRHGVAHGADLALQLVLNPKVTGAQVERLLDAVSSQVAPPGEHFYIYGEPARLARPVYYAYRRDDLDSLAWPVWFARLADPAPMDDWGEALASQAGLARRHNSAAFLRALYVAAGSAGDDRGAALAQLALEALARVQGR